jgi:NTE family protein
VRRVVAGAIAAALLGCGGPYPVEPLEPGGEPPAPTVQETERLLVATFSGGGTRAATLAQGALAALAATPLAGGGTMLDEIDIVSSTSGGSVTAGNFVARGPESFSGFERDFLRYDGMRRLKLELLNPVSLVGSLVVRNNRSEPVVDMFAERVFGDRTLGEAQARRGSPYMILNATDAGSGITFPMTQPYFDLICGDAGRYPLARAVAASAAFPVALSAVTLANQCQPAGPAEPSGRALQTVRQLLPSAGEGPSDPTGDAAGRALALRGDQLLRGEVEYLHLYDGGISDNMGLSEPLRLLTSSFEGNPYAGALDGAESLAILSVDARSGSGASYDHRRDSPNMIEALLAVTGGAIGSRMSGLAAQAAAFEAVKGALNQQECYDRAADEPSVEQAFGACLLNGEDLLRYSFIPISFNGITDPSCRAAFSAVPTSWSLHPHVVSALLMLGEGLTLAHPAYGDVAVRAGTSVDTALLRERGNAQVTAACACIRDATTCPVPDA